MSQPPVCVLTAGRGARMGAYGDMINKSLLPLGGKAIFSHIVDSFPAGTEFVVALGRQARQVRDYIALAHPSLPVRFVEVDNYDGPGSGPGRSLLCCRPHLQRPFRFIACDTLFDAGQAGLPLGADWAGLARVPAAHAAAYCTMEVDAAGRVTAIRDKQACEEDPLAFIGLLHVEDYQAFWDGLEQADIVAGEHQVSNGLRGLLAGPGLRGVEMAWTDLGDEAKYRAAVARCADYDFSKTDEFFYQTGGQAGGRVIKFFNDPRIVARRVAKAACKPEVFPAIVGAGEQFYGYDYVPGRTLYARNSPDLFRRLLTWLDAAVWTPADVPAARMAELCLDFYKKKTLQRLAAFDAKYPDFHQPRRVNGEEAATIAELLELLPWETLCDGRPAFMHGDLQFDNILHDEASDKFMLLDWRQDFAGEVTFGDLYYDLAKLLGGIILNYDYIKKDLFSYDQDGDAATVDFARRFTGDALEKVLADFVAAKGLDWSRVRLLTGVIFLNMAPLHHPPFDLALHALGRLVLTRILAPRG